jgi:hypothetical protein
MKKLTGEIQIVFLVNLVDFFSSPKPGLYQYFEEYRGRDFTTQNLQEEYNRFYTGCISENLQLKAT